MFSQDDISQMVEEYLGRIPLPAQPEELYSPMTYALGGGGKRLRPMLLVAGCDLFSESVDAALPCAAAVEFFHNFTLMHDDIMDNAALRRGKESVYRKWGTNSAILSGDAMMIFSYRLIEMSPPDRLGAILAQFNAMALEVCEGQQFDMEFEAREQVTSAEYIHMISLKTGALVARPLYIGALVGGADERNCRALYDFGYALGIAFQLQDDLLDTYGDEESFGKSIGGDIVEGKKTFLVISAMATEWGRELRRVLADTSMAPQRKIELVRALFDKAGAPAAARRAIAHHTARALEALARVEVDEERLAILRDITVGLLNRSK